MTGKLPSTSGALSDKRKAAREASAVSAQAPQLRSHGKQAANNPTPAKRVFSNPKRAK